MLFVKNQRFILFIIPVFLTLYFEIIIDSQEVANTVERRPMSSSAAPPIVASYITKVDYQARLLMWALCLVEPT